MAVDPAVHVARVEEPEKLRGVSRLGERFGGSDVGVGPLLREAHPLAAVERLAQVGFAEDAGECGAVAHLLACGVEADARAAAVERLGNLLAVFTDAGVDAHARDDDSVLFHCLRV